MKKTKLSVPVILAIFLLVTLVAMVSYHIIQIATVKSQDELEDPPEAWSEASYIIWKSNSTWTAYRNMSVQMVEDWENNPNVNASYIFQTVIDLTTTEGGLIFVKRGTYTIDVTLTLKSNVYLQGEGKDVTILHYTGSSTLFNIQDATNIRISDLTIEGE